MAEDTLRLPQTSWGQALGGGARGRHRPSPSDPSSAPRQRGYHSDRKGVGTSVPTTNPTMPLQKLSTDSQRPRCPILHPPPTPTCVRTPGLPDLGPRGSPGLRGRPSSWPLLHSLLFTAPHFPLRDPPDNCALWRALKPLGLPRDGSRWIRVPETSLGAPGRGPC